jgi:CspA family cold shock protein
MGRAVFPEDTSPMAVLPQESDRGDASVGPLHKPKQSNQTNESELTMRGTVKFFDASKGFGFCRRDDGNGDTFVHIKQCCGVKMLHEGDRIEFDLGINPKNNRPQAIDVRLLKQDGSDPAADDPVATPRYGEVFFERGNEVD